MKENITQFMSKYKTPLLVIGALLLVWAIWYFTKSSKSDGSLESLAKCLKSKGAKFYGASWCPHCQSQKKMFGDAAKYLPYVECSNDDRSQKKVCVDAGVNGYPMWKFANGKTMNGELTLQQLKDASGC